MTLVQGEGYGRSMIQFLLICYLKTPTSVQVLSNKDDMKEDQECETLYSYQQPLTSDQRQRQQLEPWRLHFADSDL